VLHSRVGIGQVLRSLSRPLGFPHAGLKVLQLCGLALWSRNPSLDCLCWWLIGLAISMTSLVVWGGSGVDNGMSRGKPSGSTSGVSVVEWMQGSHERDGADIMKCERVWLLGVVMVMCRVG